MKALAECSIEECRRRVASPEAAAGGGTAVLISASLGAGLLAMAAAVTLKREDPPGLTGLRNLVVERSARLLALAEEDGLAYAGWLEAVALPRQTSAEVALREARKGEALERALRIPLEAAGLCRDLLGIAERMLSMCRPHTRTDLASGALLLAAGLRGSLFNVRQNLAGLADLSRVAEHKARCEALHRSGQSLLERILESVEEQL